MNYTPFTITVRGRLVTFQRPVVMGILNITPDSFYDGGRHNTPNGMLEHARRLLDEGADIIDIGAASSRPGAYTLEQTIRMAIEAGADIVNDISGGQFDDDMLRTVADLQAPYILMHNRALPAEMQQHTGYSDIIDDLTKYFSEKLDILYRLGVKDVWLDPGFGFAKTVEENHELLHRLDELTSLFREPLLTALSRKSMIYKPLGITPDEALPGTIALDAIALLKGSRLLRVHDPKPALQTIQLLFNK